MEMGRHWLETRQRVESALAADADFVRRMRESQQGVRDLLKRVREDFARSPLNPVNQRRQIVEQVLGLPQTMQTYFQLRRALWTWPEIAGLQPGAGARRILEVVIELAREEAFPWFLAVRKDQVRRLAGLSHSRFFHASRQLECMVITRQARPMRTMDRTGSPIWPGEVDATLPPRPTAQWLLHYRRGVPFNAGRCAWWINYDLLCQTGRVLPCFAFNRLTLPRPYLDRNTPMAGVSAGLRDDDAMAAFQRDIARRGPLPRPGFRAALWTRPTATAAA